MLLTWKIAIAIVLITAPQLDARCFISGLASADYSQNSHPFASSLLHIYEWMRPNCNGRVVSVSFGDNGWQSELPARFFLGVFQSLEIDSDEGQEPAVYFQLIDYVPVEAKRPGSAHLQTFNIPSNSTLKIMRDQVIGIFYDKWDTPQNQLVVPYRSDTVNPEEFRAFVGFMSLAQLSKITQLRVGGELGIKASGRVPALTVTIEPEETRKTTDTTTLCQKPPSIPNGSVVAAPSTSATPGTFMPGDFALYTCRPGFALGPSVYASCVLGTWTPIPVCLGSCGAKIPEASHASVQMQSFSHMSKVGDVIHYICQPGYTLLEGSQRKVICRENQDGTYTWSPRPVCVPEINGQIADAAVEDNGLEEVYCQNPMENIENGHITFKSFTGQPSPGDSVRYSCKMGYKLIGMEQFCRPDGSWSQTPMCVRQQEVIVRSALVNAEFTSGLSSTTMEPEQLSCGEPPKITNAQVSKKSYEDRPSVWLDTVIYECIKGFRLQSMAIVGCSQNGTWVGFPDFPVCELAPQHLRGIICCNFI